MFKCDLKPVIGIDRLTMQAAMRGNPEAMKRAFPSNVKGNDHESEVVITRFDPHVRKTSAPEQPEVSSKKPCPIQKLKENFAEDEFDRLMAKASKKG